MSSTKRTPVHSDPVFSLSGAVAAAAVAVEAVAAAEAEAAGGAALGAASGAPGVWLSPVQAAEDVGAAAACLGAPVVTVRRFTCVGVAGGREKWTWVLDGDTHALSVERYLPAVSLSSGSARATAVRGAFRGGGASAPLNLMLGNKLPNFLPRRLTGKNGGTATRSSALAIGLRLVYPTLRSGKASLNELAS
jgi:hypothetical protein